MTKLELTTELFNIVDNLLEAGITSCNIHEARTQLDYLFDDFEESEGVSYESSQEETSDPINMTTFFCDLNKMVFNDNGIFTGGEDMVTLNNVLDDIAIKDKKLPKELKQYFHTIGNLHEAGYIPFLDESEGYFLDEAHEEITINV